MASFSMSTLPAEISISIMAFNEQNDLLQLAKTSKSHFTQALPLLYHAIDLSTHNRPPASAPHFTDGRLMFADQQPLQPTPRRIIERQHSFISSLLNHPEFGQRVERLTWTLLFTGDIGRPSPDEPPETLIVPPETSIWDGFRKLTHVKYLDFAALPTHYIPYMAEHPRVLFPSATTLRLLRVMPRSLPRCILESVDPCKLTHLALDDVQDWGLSEKGLPMTTDEAYAIGSRQMDTQNADGSPRTVYPGPMHGILLESFTRRCTALKHLHLRKAGQRCGDRGESYASADEKVYKEWAAALASLNIQETLETLVIEQGIFRKALQRSCLDETVVWPMDRRFVIVVYPVLLSGSWKSLRRLQLEGIPLGPGSKERALREQLGPMVDFTVRKDARKSCTRFRSFSVV